MTSLKQRVMTGLRWQAAAKLGSQLVSWTITIFVMRLLAPADYGLMAMTIVVVGLTALIAELGLGAALVRAPDAPPLFQRQVFGLALMVNLALYALLLGMAPVSAAVFDQPELLMLTAVTGLQLPLAALHVVPESMARREMRFKALSLVELSTQIAGAGTTLAAATAGWGVWSLVAGHLAASAAKTVMLFASFGWTTPRFSLRGQGELVRYGSSLTLNRVVWYFASQADVFIAGRVLGAQLLGTYAVAANLASMPMQKLMAISNQVAFSAYSKLQSDREALHQGLQTSVGLMLAVSVGLLWALAGTATELVPLLLGSQWIPAIAPLQVIALIVPLRIFTAMLSTALIATGHVGADLRNTACQAAIMVPAFYVGAVTGSVAGLAYAWAIGYPLFAAYLFMQTRATLGLGFHRLYRAARGPIVAGLCMVGSMMLTSSLMNGQSAVIVLLLKCGIGSAAFVLILHAMDRSMLASARLLMGFGGQDASQDGV